MSMLAGCASHQPRKLVENELFAEPRPRGISTVGTSAALLRFLVRASFNGYAQDNVHLRHALAKAEVHAGLRKLMRSRTAALWIGHSTFLLRVGGLTILTDPVFSETASPVPIIGPRRYVPPALAISELPAIDAILVSHNHYDHLDKFSLAELGWRFPDVAVFLPTGNENHGIDAGIRRIRGLKAGESVTFRGVHLLALPSNHQMNLIDSTRALSFSLRAAGGPSLFFAGDTAYGPSFRQIRAAYGPHDVALVPIGGYEPREEERDAHASPEEALKIAADLGAKVALGMHWGTFPLSDEPLFEPPQRFMRARQHNGAKPVVLRIGECLVLD
jgi:N-acyl-phosphatidylethanolamine-hydrolysing phospholipase D